MSRAEEDPDVAQAREFLAMLAVHAARLETDLAMTTSAQQRAAGLADLRQVRRFIDGLHRRFPCLADG